ncbi:MAG: hypothetical protein L0Y55_11325, partial [Anaerolineales bacterium]|nr:hypothetical protein [Anaerolineales bacterium]
MTRQEQFRRNNDLFELFMHQVLKRPALAKKIPKGAQVIFLPENDRDLSNANLRLAQTVRKQGGKVALIKITLVPQVVTVYTPRLEFAEAA